jgi:hypothetical protein
MATNATPSDSEKRAVKALTDVVAVEQYAPGMVRVVTWSDAYIVDARGGGCNCPDKEYNIHESTASSCKHEQAAMLYDSDTVQSLTVDDDLSTPSASASQQVATDGGNVRPAGCGCMDEYTLDDPLPCYPCVRDGFDNPNPSAPSEDMADADSDPVAVADGGKPEGDQ